MSLHPLKTNDQTTLIYAKVIQKKSKEMAIYKQVSPNKWSLIKVVSGVGWRDWSGELNVDYDLIELTQEEKAKYL